MASLAAYWDYSFRGITVIRYLPILFVSCLGYSSPACTQEVPGPLPDATWGMGMGEISLNSPDSPYAMPMPMPMQGGRSVPRPGRPVVILPMSPMPSMSPYPGAPSGLHGPGSYVPRETPLHRFNGYVVCDPPPHRAANTVATGPEAGMQERPERVVKITSTRSPAAPGYLQPCPIYTVNGEPPRQESRLKTTPAAGKPMKP